MSEISAALPLAAPCRLNDENSPAKFQNVRGDSLVFGCETAVTGAGQRHAVEQITKKNEHGTNHPCRNNNRRSETAR